VCSSDLSKTVNLPTDCTIEDIEDAYLEAWKMGLKAIAVYRDGCKRTQPLSTGTAKAVAKADAVVAEPVRLIGPPAAVRRKLPDERHSITHKFSIAGHEGYITVGLYEDGQPGEIFVRMAKEGSTIAGLMDSFATALSLSLQHGVPLKLLVEKFKSTRFEPSGFTGNPDVPRTSSIMDYIFRWLDLKFILPREAAAAAGTAGPQLDLKHVPALPPISAAHGGNGARTTMGTVASGGPKQTWVTESDAPACHECDAIMVRSGACHKCLNCGATSGCS